MTADNAQQPVDLRRVAQRSGVSVSTASRALSGAPRVSISTRRKVQAAATALGYRPNATAQALRTSRSRLIGLVVTNLANASFVVIADVVGRRLAERGYQLVLSVTGGDAESERAALRTLIDHNATGVILVGSDTEATQDLQRLGVAVVHLARRPDTPAGDCVLGDDLAGARAATGHLVAQGHRRIAIIAGPAAVTSGRERLLGYRIAMAESQRTVREEWIVTGEFTPATGAAGIRTLMRLPARIRPTALIVANHEASSAALAALDELGVGIPAQLSVICFEDDELLKWWHPAITVVDNNAADMGELAARLLLERIDGITFSGADIREFRIGTRLITRGSCGPPASARRASPLR
jgi:LacI family transcriptional regulator